jgi:hypothetical protein
MIILIAKEILQIVNLNHQVMQLQLTHLEAVLETCRALELKVKNLLKNICYQEQIEDHP